MKKKLLTAGNFLIILGILLAIFGGIQIIIRESEEVPQDVVVEEDQGFLPVFVPESAQEVFMPDSSNQEFTPQAPEINIQSTPNLPTNTPAESTDDVDIDKTLGPAIPNRIIIPKINLDAPVIEAGTRKVRVNGQIFEQYTAPDEFAAGWHPDSALLGSIGNTVLNGHHNVHDEVFGNLIDLEPGDIIYLFSGERKFAYMVANKMILPELGEDITVEQRLQNARWIMASSDERLTLVTCWPAYSNTHRLILVAKPIQLDLIPAE